MNEINYKGVKINEVKANILLRKIVLKEVNNLKTKQFSDNEMVKEIKKIIEEEVNCY
jgi:hypothetical protein